jgi:hypothetical protein
MVLGQILGIETHSHIGHIESLPMAGRFRLWRKNYVSYVTMCLKKKLCVSIPQDFSNIQKSQPLKRGN